ncbi:MAG: hypothetical protein JNM41_07485 [Flavipsychrobacter sp.]|nr:hypothetical protein [Flavipsychrobacter sp.]
MFEEKRVGIVAPTGIAAKLNDAVGIAGMPIIVLPTGNGSNTNDQMNIIRLGQECDSVLIMDEQTDTDVLRTLQMSGMKVYPHPDVIDIIRDKEHQLSLLEENGIPAVTGWEVVANAEETDHQRHGAQSYLRDTLDPKPTLAFRAKARTERQTSMGSDMSPAFAADKIVSVPVTRTSDNTITCHAPVLMISTDNHIYADHRMCKDEGERESSLACCRLAASVATAIGLTGTINVEIVRDERGNTYVNDMSLLPNTNFTRSDLKAHPLTRELGEILDLLPDTNKPRHHTGIFEPAAFKKNAVRGALRSITCPDVMRLQRTGRLPDEMEMNELTARSMMVQYLLQQ